MDPGYENAAVLKRAAIQLNGSGKPFLSQIRLVEDKFQEGISLYRQGRLVEASERLEEASKLSPWNVKVRYWLGRVRKDLAEEHFERGERAYEQHRLPEALDQWYSALVLNPHYPRLVGMISAAEAQLREQNANEQLQQALTLYGQGDTVNALRMLDKILETVPGDSKAQQLISEIRSEMASQHVDAGRALFKQGQFEKAIDEWHKATDYGFDPKEADLLIGRARDAERQQEDKKRLAVERAKEKAEEDKKEAAEEEAAKAKAEEEAKQREAEAAAKPAVQAAPAPAAPSGPSPTAQKESQQHYLTGVIAFQQGNYQKARDEWTLARQLDPTNADAEAGIEKINRLLGGE
jgi:tetratricopeptide (TPR) repeat protein